MVATLVNKAPQLQEWAERNQPAQHLTYRDGYWQQIIFVRDRIAEILSKTYEEFETIQKNITVISTHHSKSVCLPVFRIELADGTQFTLRYNFHDWKISVNSPTYVEVDFMGLFDPTSKVSATCCEGFPEDALYGPYTMNGHKFTLELAPSNENVYTFFWIFAYRVLGINGIVRRKQG